jgi:DNA-binding CsgD family transcriptional regulator
MVTGGSAEVLHGRREERQALERLLAAVRDGQGRALAITGAPGVGKTALLESAIRSAPGFRIVRAAGVESEMELAFAALHQLCEPMLDRLDGLPVPQRDALGVAFGLSAGNAPDRFLVGLAVLSLLSEVAEEQPLLCVVDDAHWLDRASAQAFAFVARRLLADSVALVFATRGSGDDLLNGLQQLVVEGLPDGDARTLLRSVMGGPVDERVREQIIAETRGNPLALLELPRELPPAQLAGGFGLPGVQALPKRIEDSFRRRLAALPVETQQLLLAAAADPLGDPVLLWRAAGRLGIGVDAAADTDGLLTIGTRVTFRHPLVRSAVYHAVSAEERQAVHRALADATDRDLDPDHRAWHLARATSGLDEEIAVELERSAARAQARGGLAAAAAFLERAAGLTPEPARRAQRALAAAQAKHQAGAPDAALRLVAIAESGPLDNLQSAQADLLRGEIAFALSRGRDAPPLLLKAAKRLAFLDARLARDTYLEALSAAMHAGRLGGRNSVRNVAEAARRAPSLSTPLPRDLLLDALAVLHTEGYAAGTPMVKRALHAFSGDELSSEEGIRWLWLACRTAMAFWEDESWFVLAARQIQLARDAGALTVLPLALNLQAGIQLIAGEFAAAEASGEEAHAVSDAIGNPGVPYLRMNLAAHRGRQDETLRLTAAAERDAIARGEGRTISVGKYATAVLYNGLAQYDDALIAARQATAYPEDLAFFTWGLIELIEAGVRSGHTDVARDGLDRLSQTTTPSGTDWALGVEARSRALLTEGDAAEPLYHEAIERLATTRARVELARAHLLYGEWLRRQRRRLDAREQLRHADESFTEFGMQAFAERARIELEATGERARKRIVETRDDLTPQEAQISRLAAEGATNQEIAAQLFISPSTVDYHLRKAFRKLGVKSRHQLARHLPEPGTPREP